MRTRSVFFVAATAICGVAISGTACAQGKSLIPRTAIFGNPDRAGAEISPDGKRISYLAPVEGVMNLWVGPAKDLKSATSVTKDKGRGIRQYFWTYDNKHILYLQDVGGTENDHLFRLNLDTLEVKDLTPIKDVKVQVSEVSYKHPHEILIGLNDRNPQLHDIYKLNLDTGERTLVFKNDQYAQLITDDNLNARLGAAFGMDFRLRISKLLPGGKSETILTVPTEDTLSTQPIGFDKNAKSYYLIDSIGRDKAVLRKTDIESGKSEMIFESRKSDVGSVMMHPTEKTVQAAKEYFDRGHWIAVDPSVKGDLEALAKVSEGDFDVTSTTLDDKLWLVTYNRDDAGVATYLYDRAAHKAKFLFTNRSALKDYKLAKMRPVVIKSRDGLDLVSYLTLPVGSVPSTSVKPKQPLPMVLWVHGGPWGRDNWGYNGVHQWLANRGYAVLSVNYRGSTGLGKNFVNAANKEWAGKMHDDLIDAVDWAIKEGVADPKRVAIAGGSYGGYATLVGLTFTPDKFACGVDLVGPSNLITLMKNVPPYWVPILPMLTSRVGDPKTEEGRKLLMERSPLTKANEIRRPLLIGQGANDPRVNQVEADQIAKAIKDRGLPVTYLLYPDEGHGFARPENNLSFFSVMEGFLSKHLGGKAEGIGEAFYGSSVKVLEDGGDVPGLKEAEANKKEK